MTATLVRKLLRDIRLALVVVALLLGAFQCLWAKITEQLLGKLLPYLWASGLVPDELVKTVFEGPGAIVRNLLGGETVRVDRAMDLMSIGYVHPLVQFILCVWAVGRAAGAIAGEVDRGTMELLLAQPVARYRLILAHFCVDLIVLPLLCLSLWGGTCLGTWLVGPIHPHLPENIKPPRPGYIVELGPLKVRLENPADLLPKQAGDSEAMRQRLKIEPLKFAPALWVVGGLMFALSGFTIWLSSLGRFRWRVLGLAVFIGLLQFLLNLLGPLWDVLEPLRPLSIFYYFQPQQVILSGDWYVPLGGGWHGGQPWCRVPMVAVLLGVGLAGYALALRTFHRRDLPAPL